MSDSHASYTSRCAAAFAAGELSPLQGGWVLRSTAPRYNTSCFALTTKLTCEFDHRRQRATEWQWTAIRGRLHAACAPPPMKAAYFTDLPHRILLLGDSRVRQLFESILCTHRHDLTDGVRRVIPAAERPRSTQEHRTHFLRSDWRLGTLQPLTTCPDSCLKTDGAGARATFLDGALSVAFVTLPAHYYAVGQPRVPGSELPQLLERLGMPLPTVTVAVLGGGYGNSYGDTTSTLESTLPSLGLRCGALMDVRPFQEILKAQQAQQRLVAGLDARPGRAWFCARSPEVVRTQLLRGAEAPARTNRSWLVSDASDEVLMRETASLGTCDVLHPCTPGIPDDVSNVVLWAARHGIRLAADERHRSVATYLQRGGNWFRLPVDHSFDKCMAKCTRSCPASLPSARCRGVCEPQCVERGG